MGLPSRHGIRTARLPKIKSLKIPGEPGHPQARLFVNLINYAFDKGKPAERQGRKAMGLHPAERGQIARLPKAN